MDLRDSNSDSRWYYGNNETNYIIVDPTDGLKTLNGKGAISKIDSVVTGVKNVDIDVYTYTDAGSNATTLQCGQWYWRLYRDRHLP